MRPNNNHDPIQLQYINLNTTFFSLQRPDLSSSRMLCDSDMYSVFYLIKILWLIFFIHFFFAAGQQIFQTHNVYSARVYMCVLYIKRENWKIANESYNLIFASHSFTVSLSSANSSIYISFVVDFIELWIMSTCTCVFMSSTIFLCIWWVFELWYDDDSTNDV